MNFFEPEEYQDKVNLLFNQVQKDLKEILEDKRFEHIGASAIKGAVSKGDLDIFLGVDRNNFRSTIEQLKQVDFREKENTLSTNELCMMITEKYNYDVAIQVVVNGSKFEDFIKFRDLLNSRPDLLEELNVLKRGCRGYTPEKYRETKSSWVEKILSEC